MIARHIMIPVGKGTHDPELLRWTHAVAADFEACVRARGLADPGLQAVYSFYIHIAGDAAFDDCGRSDPSWPRLDVDGLFASLARSPTHSDEHEALAAGILFDFFDFLVESERLPGASAEPVLAALRRRLDAAYGKLDALADAIARPANRAERRAAQSQRRRTAAHWLN